MTALSLARSAALAVAILALPGPFDGASARAQPQTGASANDVARFLAGMPPADGSPLAAVAREASWRSHARSMDVAWASIERRQLSKIRDWSAANLTAPRKTLFYMFSGPDFLYADTFFPKAETYLMSGLEPTGPVPEVVGGRRRSLSYGLAELRSSIGSVMNYSFFRTREMRTTLGTNSFSGTLPILYIFLARTGQTIDEVTLFDVDEDGAEVAAGAGRPKGAAQGAKIRFTGKDGKSRTILYVRSDVSNTGLKRSGFAAFLNKHEKGDGLVKSASYLMHSGAFSQIRELLLEKTARLVQDDSGIPVTYFKTEEWTLRPFGRYLGPIGLFPDNYQKPLATVFRRGSPPRIDFGIGYRFRPSESNLLVADRKEAATQ